MKKKIMIVVAVIAMIFLISNINFSSADEYYKNEDSNDTQQVEKKDEEKKTTKKEESQKKDTQKKSSNTTSKSDSTKNEVSKTPPKKKTDYINVKINIDVNTLVKDSSKLDPALKKYVPKNGYILGTTSIKVKKGSTVYDVLKAATKKYGIQMEHEGAGNTLYLKGINHIYEFSAGNESGWHYSVNGKFPNYGLANYKIKNKDTIRFLYTLNLGCDIGNCW